MALEVASGRGADLVLVDGGYGFEALVQAGVVTHARRGGDWVFACPSRAGSERAGRLGNERDDGWRVPLRCSRRPHNLGAGGPTARPAVGSRWGRAQPRC